MNDGKFVKKIKIGEKNNDGYDDWWCCWYECPECKKKRITRVFKYCPDCGSELIWEDSEAEV